MTEEKKFHRCPTHVRWLDEGDYWRVVLVSGHIRIRKKEMKK